MSKQDRQGVRTPADVERKWNFGKSFAEVYELSNDALIKAEEAQEEVENLDKSLNQEEIFNRLTNNGAAQGIYRENGDIFINASYIKTGEFVADLIKTGILKSKDEQTFYLDLDTGILKGKFAELMINGKTVDQIAETKAGNAVSSQSQTDIFNKLTNNGQEQGIYMKEGKIYINASYIMAGIIDAAVVQVKNLIAEKLKSVSGLSELNIDGSILKLLSNGNKTIEVVNEYEGSPIIYMKDFEGGAQTSAGEYSPHHLKIGGTSADPILEFQTLTGYPTLKIDGTYRELSWKYNGDGTYTLIGR